jgi:hypothetical protein
MNIKSVYKYFLILLFVISINRSYAQEPGFSASLSNSTVSLGERFQVTFTLTASGKDFTPPAFKDFTVIQGPMQTNSVQFINGSMTQSISFVYVLQPKAEGVFKIGSASIIFNGKIFHSNPLTVTVAKGNKKQGEDDVSNDIAKNLFIKPIYNKTTVYQGEGIFVTYKLFTRVNLVNFNPTKMPELNGFWNQEVSRPQQIQLKREVIDGVEYNTAEIKKMVLFPQHSGTLLLDPMEAESVVRLQAKRRQSQDPFDQFFNDPFFNAGRFEDVNYKISSKPVKITVLPLPPNAPEGFSGAVGDFAMNAFIDKPETKTNEAVSLKIKISGKGNIKLIDPVKASFPSDIESYNPKTTDNIAVNENGVSGSRTFEYLLIPRHPGEFKIAPIHFSYFDPGKKKYIELESPPFTLKVTKGANDIGTSASSSSGVSKEELQLLGKDIRYIKTDQPEFDRRGKYFFNSPLYYILLGSPLLLFIAFIFYRKKQKELHGNTVLFKSKRATQIAKKRLISAKKFMKENNKEKFHDEILKSIWGYTSDKLNIPLADLSRDNAVSALRTRNINEELIKKYTSTIDHCEFARYAPAGSSATMENIYQDTMHIITQLEQDLK